MVREISAGGVVVRKKEEVWWMAAIQPPAAPEATPASGRGLGSAPGISEVAISGPVISKRVKSKPDRSKAQPVLCLPKGLVDEGEKPLEAALREVREETGITAAPIVKLADIKYVYVRSWGDGERVFKIVSFYLLRYESGRIDNIAKEMRIEVACAKWVRLEDAPKLLAYRGEKQMARKALEYLRTHPEV
jgi:8-oxo-dGTP pyrophosphatase MutT (NUDIX family)